MQINNQNLIFIDTEYNGFGGELMSMALVGCDGRELYEVMSLSPDIKINSWVLDNVVPNLGKDAVSYDRFQDNLYHFLSYYDWYHGGFILIADWPDDFRYFCQSLIISSGGMMPFRKFEMKMDRSLDCAVSEVPHNALYDARAIKAKFLSNNEGQK